MLVVMNARFLFVFSALLLLFANGAFAGGAYQRTKDGKTRVWNNHPTPGDAVTWSGKRDKDGYATGSGTLTWYKTDRVLITGSNIRSAKHIAGSRYSGTMVRGKLEGPVVNVDPNGKTFHGTFVDGRKTKDWAAGRAPGPSRTDIAADRQRDEQVHQDVAAEAEPPPPAVGPSEPPVVPHPPPLQGDGATKQTTQNIPGPAAKETPSPAVDDSLQSLISPQSLRMKLAAEASPRASKPPTASSPSTAGPRLTAAEVIELANAEANKRGYKVGEYQRPQADFTAADETWSVSYDQKYADGFGKHFSVSVEDKTKKASIAAGR
jgi:hypothetical protein